MNRFLRWLATRITGLPPAPDTAHQEEIAAAARRLREIERRVELVRARGRIQSRDA